MGNLRCPFCRHDTFIRTIKEEVRMVDDGQMITDEQEGFVAETTYVCAKCGNDVTDRELVR
jgi:transposase-like protein